MVLVVVFVHAVAANGLQVLHEVQFLAQPIEMPSVGAVVNRVRLWYTHDPGVGHIRFPRQPELLELRSGERGQVLVSTRPQAVTLETEVLHPEARDARYRHHRGTPVVEV